MLNSPSLAHFFVMISMSYTRKFSIIAIKSDARHVKGRKLINSHGSKL